MQAREECTYHENMKLTPVLRMRSGAAGIRTQVIGSGGLCPIQARLQARSPPKELSGLRLSVVQGNGAPSERDYFGGGGVLFQRRTTSAANRTAANTTNPRRSHHQFPRKLGIVVEGGVYVNFLADAMKEMVEAASGASLYRKLTSVKAKYDPTNFFRLNHNIPPKGT